MCTYYYYSRPALHNQLRHVQVIYSHINMNMLCSGLLIVGGRDQNYCDVGGPFTHEGVIVGSCSWSALWRRSDTRS